MTNQRIIVCLLGIGLGMVALIATVNGQESKKTLLEARGETVTVLTRETREGSAMPPPASFEKFAPGPSWFRFWRAVTRVRAPSRPKSRPVQTTASWSPWSGRSRR